MLRVYKKNGWMNGRSGSIVNATEGHVAAEY